MEKLEIAYDINIYVAGSNEKFKFTGNKKSDEKNSALISLITNPERHLTDMLSSSSSLMSSLSSSQELDKLGGDGIGIFLN